LERVKRYYQNWVKPGYNKGDNTNNVSVTVYVRDGEWEEVGEWMWVNNEYYNGISVLPYDGGTYKDAPFQEVDDITFNTKLENIRNVKIDLTKIIEEEDKTDLKGELACAGGSCEII